MSDILNQIAADLEEPATERADPLEAIVQGLDEPTPRQKAEQNERLVQDYDPEKQIMAIRYARGNDVPIDAAYRKGKLGPRVDWDNTDASVTALMANEIFAPVIKDDVSNLDTLSKVLKSIPQAWQTGTSQQELMDIGWRRMMGRATPNDLERQQVLEAELKDRVDYDLGYLSGVPEAMLESLPMTVQAMWRAKEEAAAAGAAGAGIGAVAGGAGMSWLPGVGTFAGAGGGAVAGGTYGLGVGFLGGTALESGKMLAGEGYQAALKTTDANGDPLDFETARGVGVAYGALGSVLEVASFKKLLQTVPGAGPLFDRAGKAGFKRIVDLALSNPRARSAMVRLGKLAQASFTEGVVEGSQEIVLIASLLAGGGVAEDGENLLDMGNNLKRVTHAFVKGTQGGLGMGAPGTAVGLVADARGARADYNARQLQQVSNAAKKSKSLARAPEIADELFKDPDGQEGPSRFSVEAAQLQTFFQEAGVTPQEVAAQHPSLAARLVESQHTGVEIELSNRDVTLLSAMDGFEALSEHIRVGHDQLTAVEARNLHEEYAQVTEQLTQELAEPAKPEVRIEAHLTRQLVAAGQAPEAAAMQAKMMASGIEAQAERAGVEPQELMERYKLEIESSVIKAEEMAPVLDMIRDGAEPADLTVAASLAETRAIMETTGLTPDSLKNLTNEQVVEHIGQRALFQPESQVPVTSAAAFQAWFGDSQVVDGAGAPKVVYRGSFDPASPDILFQSADIRRGLETLERFGLDPDQRNTTRVVAAALEDRQREVYGVIERGDYSPEASEKIANWMTEEVMFEVDQAKIEPEKSAVGWYSSKFQNALDAFGQVFPELVGEMDMNLPGLQRLGTQQAVRDFYTAVIALTSDGARVADNFRYAAQVFGEFRETGQLPTEVSFGHERNKSMRVNLKNLQAFLDAHEGGFAEKLLEKLPVSQLKKMAKEAGLGFNTQYKAKMELPMSALVFGPKLGAFYANLMGDTGYLTMDRWWSRTFNRYRGTLLDAPTQTGLQRLKGLLGDAEMSDDEALAHATAHAKAYERKGYKDGTEIEKASNTLYKAAFVNLQDQPFNASDREFMINTTMRAKDMLADMGVDLTVADIQAVLWYYEKRLYGELGARQTQDISYEEIAREIAAGDAGQLGRAGPDAGEPGQQGYLDPDDAEQVSTGITSFNQADVGSAAFKAWAGTDQVIEPDQVNSHNFSGKGPFVMGVFHGTTHEFDEFDASLRGEITSHFGKVNYFSSSKGDVDTNYAGEGPDLTQRIELRVEQLVDEMMDADETWSSVMEETRRIMEAVSSDVPLEDGPATAKRLVELDRQKDDLRIKFQQEAEDKARAELSGGEGKTMELFVRTEKPFVVNGDEGIFVEFYDPIQLRQDAVERVAADTGLSVEDINESPDVHEDAVMEAEWEIQGEMEHPLFEAIDSVASRLGFDGMKLWADLTERLEMDATDHTTLENALRDHPELMEAEIPDEPGLAHFQAMAEVIQELGFDSIILKNADGRFPGMRMPPGTAHVHVFDANNTNIKSVDNRGTFDPATANIYYQGSPFFSAVKAAVDAFQQPKGSGQQWIGMIRNAPGIKQEELEWIGVEDWLKDQKSVTKQELQEYIDANQLRVEDVVRGRPQDTTEIDRQIEEAKTIVRERQLAVDALPSRLGPEAEAAKAASRQATEHYYRLQDLRRQKSKPEPLRFPEEYMLEGGKERFEWVLTMPEQIEAYEPDILHFTTEGGGTAVGWVRGGEFEGVDGKRHLLADEVQSKRHQDARDRGYATEQPPVTVDDIDLRVLSLAEAEELTGFGRLESAVSQWASAMGLSEAPTEVAVWQLKGGAGWNIEFDKNTTAEGLLAGAKTDASFGEARNAIGHEILARQRASGTGVPDAPFKTSWHMLMMKRMLRHAVEQGFDNLSWTPGDVQADRYDLRKQISRIEVTPDAQGGKLVEAFDLRDVIVVTGVAAADGSFDSSGETRPLTEVFGKGISEQIMQAEPKKGFQPVNTKSGFRGPDFAELNDARAYVGGLPDSIRGDIEIRPFGEATARIEGENLSIGGEGMRQFYDKMLPKEVGKLVKKMGGKVSVSKVNTSSPEQFVYLVLYGDEVLAQHPTEAEAYMEMEALIEETGVPYVRVEEEFIEATEGVQEVWTVEITPEMREKVMEGLPLFQEPKGPRGFLTFSDNRDKFKMTLTGKADLSTFLHESGHFFLEIMQDLAERGEASSQQIADLTQLRKWMKLEPGQKIGRKEHEQFAEAFEAYLQEGKAPSKDLQSAFRAFKSWLTFIYRRLLGEDVQLNDDIRGVMDRLLATDEQIAEARAELGFTSQPQSQEELALNDQEYADYVGAWTRARDLQAQRVEAKQFLEAAKERSRAWKAERQKLAEAKREELKKSRGWQTWRALKDEPVNSESVPTDLKPLARGLSRKSADIDLDLRAELMGYQSGEAMLRDVQAARQRERDIPAEVDGEMVQKHGFMTDEQLTAEARKAVHNDETQEVLLTEFRAYAEQADIKVYSGLSKVLKAQAEEKVAQMTEQQLNPAKWRQAELRAASEAARHAAKGDRLNAALAKRKQMVSFAMGRATMEAQERIAKIKTYLVPFTANKRRAALGKAGEMYLDGVDTILESIEFKEVSWKDLEKRKTLAQIIEEAEANDEALQIPDNLVELLGKKNYRQMTLSELQAVEDAVKNLWHLARLKNKLKVNKEQREVQEFVKEVSDAASKRKDVRFTDKRVKTWADRAVDRMRSLRSHLVKMEFLFTWLDGAPSGGPAHSALYQPLVDARFEEHKLLKRFNETLYEKIRDLPDEQRTRWEAKTMFMGEEMNGQNIIAVALNIGNQGSLDKLLRGHDWDEVALRAALDSWMTKADWDMVQHIWSEINTLWPKISDVAFKASGLRPPKVDAMPVDTPYGTYEGGYYPVVYDPSRRVEVYTRTQAKEQSGGIWANNFMRPAVGDGFTKKRTKYTAPILLDLSVLSRHVGEIVHYVTHYEAVSQIDKLTRNPVFEKTVREKFGKEFYQQIRPWLQDIANAGHNKTVDELGEKLGRYLRSGTSIASMGFNVWTALKQQLGHFTALDALPAKYVLSGLHKTVLSGQKKNWQFGLENSQELVRLIEEFDRDIKTMHEAWAQTTSRSFKDQVLKHAFTPIAYSQLVVNMATWHAAYEQALDLDQTHDQAVVAADAIVRQTQSAAGMADMARIQRSGELSKAISMYYTFASVLYNRMESIAQETNTMKDLPRAFQRVLVLIMLPTFSEALGRQFWNALMEDEDELEALPFLTQWMLDALGYSVMGVPVLRDFVSALKYRPRFSPYAQIPEDMVRFLDMMGDIAVKGEAPTRKQVRSTVSTVSVITKTPVSSVYRLVDDLAGE